ncbi:hypothetical protein EPN44_01470 [bacterium]|nr:MAG: hypothetical protein EPN44_01470 [bacterium]
MKDFPTIESRTVIRALSVAVLGGSILWRALGWAAGTLFATGIVVGLLNAAAIAYKNAGLLDGKGSAWTHGALSGLRVVAVGAAPFAIIVGHGPVWDVVWYFAGFFGAQALVMFRLAQR